MEFVACSFGEDVVDFEAKSPCTPRTTHRLPYKQFYEDVVDLEA